MAGDDEKGPLHRLHDVQDIQGVTVRGDGVSIQWSVSNEEALVEVRMSLPEAHKLLGQLTEALQDDYLGTD